MTARAPKAKRTKWRAQRDFAPAYRAMFVALRKRHELVVTVNHARTIEAQVWQIVITHAGARRRCVVLQKWARAANDRAHRAQIAVAQRWSEMEADRLAAER